MPGLQRIAGPAASGVVPRLTRVRPRPEAGGMVTTSHSRDVRRRRTTGSVVSFGFGVGSYVAFLAALLYAVAFLTDVAVPRTVDHGGPQAGSITAAVIDAALLAVFALQHSVM